MQLSPEVLQAHVESDQSATVTRHRDSTEVTESKGIKNLEWGKTPTRGALPSEGGSFLRLLRGKTPI